jgi:hypothetical protein
MFFVVDNRFFDSNPKRNTGIKLVLSNENSLFEANRAWKKYSKLILKTWLFIPRNKGAKQIFCLPEMLDMAEIIWSAKLQRKSSAGRSPRNRRSTD